MNKPRRRKSTVYHIVYSAKVRNPNAKQIVKNISRDGLLQYVSLRRPADEQKLREIFDEEKPKSIHPSQKSAIFFWPELMHEKVAARIVKTRIGKQALVADAGIFRDVIKRVDYHSELIENKGRLAGWAREMARKYWATTMTLEMFKKYYKKARKYWATTIPSEMKKYYAKYPVYWFRKKNAPVTLPRKIVIPEILYPHKVRPKNLRTIRPKIQKIKKKE